MVAIKVAGRFIEMSALAQTGEMLLALRDELAAIFPERDGLITQIIYALVTREHILVHGMWGTGKTDLVHTLFQALPGATVYSDAMNKFMTRSDIIGIPNPKIMQEEGRIHYERDGGILDAHFVELDEIFDASAPLLRVLLGILNERQFKRGRQVEVAKLHTAIGATNGDPAQELKRESVLGAVIDRFIFQCGVVYLKETESRHRMYQKYLTGARPATVVPFADLVNFSEVVVSANQITDPHFIAVYDEVIQAYRDGMSNRQIVSDRRACKLLKLVEACALLHGRYDVDFEDIYAVKLGLCMGGDDEQCTLFDAKAKPIIEKAIAQRQQGVDEVQIELLKQLEMRLPQVVATATPEELVALKRSLLALAEEVKAVRPKLSSTNEIKAKIQRKIDVLLKKVDRLIDGT